MAIVYLTEQGSELRKTGDRLIVGKDGQILLEIECFKIEAVILFGGVELTTPAIAELLDHGVELALLSRNGRLKGKLVPPCGKNVLLRVRQLEAAKDDEFRLLAGRAFVIGKIANCRSLLHRQERNHPEAGLEGCRKELSRYLQQAAAAPSLESLRGIEGSAARMYFRGIASCCRRELSFPGRRRRPPTDPMNALLSLGYSLLTRELWSLVEGAGLDPYIGFFHQLDYGRPSLALDLLEEFRAPIVDRLVLRITNLGQFGQKDFESHEDGGLRLTSQAFPQFLEAYEKAMTDSLRDAVSAESIGARVALRRQVERLIGSINKDEPYNALEAAL